MAATLAAAGCTERARRVGPSAGAPGEAAGGGGSVEGEREGEGGRGVEGEGEGEGEGGRGVEGEGEGGGEGEAACDRHSDCRPPLVCGPRGLCIVECVVDRDCGLGRLCRSSSCVADRDGDGIEEPRDNCPDEPNGDQRDLDGDGAAFSCPGAPCPGGGCGVGCGLAGGHRTCAEYCAAAGVPCVGYLPGSAWDDSCEWGEGPCGWGDLELQQGCDTPIAMGYPGACLREEDLPPDAFGDACDNCPGVGNPDQEDRDGDRQGDACDDGDDDGVVDALDGCPDDPDPRQGDCDGDGRGDACDPDTRDRDGDGVDDRCDVCPDEPDPGQLDTDEDGVGDRCDNCREARNPEQRDRDGDGRGDACDDGDRDGVVDADDNCPDRANAAQEDCDGDGRGDACDDEADGDGDGVPDGCDNCPEAGNPGQEDSDAQGFACPVALDCGADPPAGGHACGLSCNDWRAADEFGSCDDVCRAAGARCLAAERVVDDWVCDDPCNERTVAARCRDEWWGDEGFRCLCERPPGDGRGDACDTCPLVADPDQADCDGDGTGDLCNEDRPGAPEVCDGQDNDCDGRTDEVADGDRDGEAGWACGGADCDDRDPSVRPGAPERCNARDDDCDGETDEDLVTDLDGDGHRSVACAGDDCDDDDASVHPDAEEVCDEARADEDCDGRSNEACWRDACVAMSDCDARCREGDDACLDACWDAGPPECRDCANDAFFRCYGTWCPVEVRGYRDCLDQNGCLALPTARELADCTVRFCLEAYRTLDDCMVDEDVAREEFRRVCIPIYEECGFGY